MKLRNQLSEKSARSTVMVGQWASDPDLIAVDEFQSQLAEGWARKKKRRAPVSAEAQGSSKVIVVEDDSSKSGCVHFCLDILRGDVESDPKHNVLHERSNDTGNPSNTVLWVTLSDLWQQMTICLLIHVPPAYAIPNKRCTLEASSRTPARPFFPALESAEKQLPLHFNPALARKFLETELFEFPERLEHPTGTKTGSKELILGEWDKEKLEQPRSPQAAICCS
ncbi:hypothetical protein B0H16DRAFT_1824214 [Mycena metata]|uniref:Uncharacterized protein n=1 Tax=Mycena metata TaxID=1033252 RepID=A0AAD7MA90_9AGAR|nr:hypothetical protein B0H16DRAFT_1824214 [Mycena metata]